MTIREAILARVKTVLDPTTGVSARVYRSRVQAFAKSEHPAIVIEPVSDNAARTGNGRLSWELNFVVIIVVRADSPDTSADAIMADAHTRMLGDATLQGQLVDMVPVSTEWQFIEGDKTLGIISMHYKAIYQTSETSLGTL